MTENQSVVMIVDDDDSLPIRFTHTSTSASVFS
jgi:hypothetical protein